MPFRSLVLLPPVSVLSGRDFIQWPSKEVIDHRGFSFAVPIRGSVEASNPILSVDDSDRSANIAIRLPFQQIIQNGHPRKAQFEECLTSNAMF